MIEIRYGETTFLAEGDWDDVYRKVRDGCELEVIEQRAYPQDPVRKKIAFLGDPDWVAVEL